MKKVRFQSPVKTFKIKRMEDSECHSPRPIIERQVKLTPNKDIIHYKSVPYTNDPVQIYECSNSSPCPKVSKTHLSSISNVENRWSPSNELELSTLDCANSDSTRRKQNLTAYRDNIHLLHSKHNIQSLRQNDCKQILKPIENIVSSNEANVMGPLDDFFLKKGNMRGLEELQTKIKSVHLSKENNPLLKKKEIMDFGCLHVPTMTPSFDVTINDKMCRCHHCVQVFHTKPYIKQVHENKEVLSKYQGTFNSRHCVSKPSHALCWPCNYHTVSSPPLCNCSNTSQESALNTIDKKTWAIKKYEQAQKTECLDVELQHSVLKEKREPTVGDLFKIIKLQNEQLQLLQRKVDDFISTNKKQDKQIVTQPIENDVTKHVEVESVGTEQKMSIGVMTSFEMIRTSTVINKEIVQQNEAQIQCNRSQISIKGVVAKSHPVHLNFLDGLIPVPKDQTENKNDKEKYVDLTKNTDNFEDKTFNEMSLYNVQVDNAITPLMSPEQSLYLDVRDYSDSDASGDDQSNVGWTYYNKVMTHVNGILQESDMPSSASALYRKAQQKCMQIDKTNVSVAKRVTFGDDPLSNQQNRVPFHAMTDTSLKMNQLAAKYLKNSGLKSNSPSPKPAVPVDMSLATRNYMEKHKIIHQGTNFPPQTPSPQIEMPRFLDITALKQQPKFL